MDAAALRALLTAPDAVVGPACSDVDVPPTINMEENFREAYVQGYRHALSDLRAALQAGRTEPPPQSEQALRDKTIAELTARPTGSGEETGR